MEDCSIYLLNAEKRRPKVSLTVSSDYIKVVCVRIASVIMASCWSKEFCIISVHETRFELK